MSDEYDDVPIQDMIQKLKDTTDEEKLKPILENIWSRPGEDEHYLDPLMLTPENEMVAVMAIDEGYQMVHHAWERGKNPSTYRAARKKILEMWPKPAETAGPSTSSAAKPPPPSGPPPFRGVKPPAPAGPPPSRVAMPPAVPPPQPPGPPKAFGRLQDALKASRGQGRKKTAKKSRKTSRKTKRWTTRRM